MKVHPTMQHLIQQRRDETGWTVRALADATGGAVSHQSLSDIATGKRKEWPRSVEAISGLARALNVSEQTVLMAYATGLGIPIPAQPSLLALQLPASTDLLTAAERNHIVGLVIALTEGRTRSENEQSA